MTAADWYQQYLPSPADVPLPKCRPARSDWERVTVDGQPGGLFGGDYWCNLTEVLVLSHGRVYDVRGVPDPEHLTEAVFDRGVLDAFLSSMRLSP